MDPALGYGELASFGHAGFLGLGACAAALVLRHVTPPFWVALGAGVLAAPLLGPRRSGTPCLVPAPPG